MRPLFLAPRLTGSPIRRIAPSLVLFAFFACFAVPSLLAVPQIISYQGRVSVGGVNFDGSGDFKFALVDSSGATTHWSNDGTSAAGSEPSAAVSITVTKGIYSVLLGDAALTNMTAIPFTVFDNDEVFLRVWFDDGTNGSQQLSPDQRIAAVGYAMISNTVADGAITTAKLAGSAVTSDKIADGTVTAADLSSLATPDSLSGVSGVVLSTDPAQGDLLAGGYLNMGTLPESSNIWVWETVPWVTAGQHVEGRYDHSMVWTGTEMIVWGGIHSTTAATSTGGRYNPATDTWTPVTDVGDPVFRAAHTAVWTGTEMIVWGGSFSGNNTGGRYDPVADSWTATSLTNAPLGRREHTAVWTGTEMIVWGGDDHAAGTNPLDTGGRYTPSTDTWTATSLTNAPAARRWHTAVWTGTEMIVWGGGEFGSELNTGGRYTPSTDTWTATDTADPDLPSARRFHTAVWTGTEMIIWGGDPSGPVVNTGGRYNPSSDSWTATDTVDADTPAARFNHTAVWSGTEMIVWGGSFSGLVETNTGGRYDPATDSWTTTNLSGALPPTKGHEAVWTGTEMIVWGGQGGEESLEYTNWGARYNPGTDSWTYTALPDSPPDPRSKHAAVWTGTEMIIWGGDPIGPLSSVASSGGRYNPATGAWKTTELDGAPSQRNDHTAVWTGTEMIVWGGNDAFPSGLNTGGRYNPATDAWTATTTTGAPLGRVNHAAVWDGSRMIVWGGFNGGVLNTGGHYDPVADSWTPTVPTPPAARQGHTAVWTGTKMIIWGGTDGTGTPLNTGSRYDTTQFSEFWQSMTTTDAPVGRRNHTAVWTGTEMIVWGGSDATSTLLATGARYNPATNTWTGATDTGDPDVPSARENHTAVWTGEEMLLWGGNDGADTDTGSIYDPAADSWAPMPPNPTPAAGSEHTAIWTGDRMIIWGGSLQTRGSLLSSPVYLYAKP